MKNQRDELGGASNPIINGDLFSSVILDIYKDRIVMTGQYKYNSWSEELEIRKDFNMFDLMRMSKGEALMLDYLTENDLWKIHKFLNGQN